MLPPLSITTKKPVTDAIHHAIRQHHGLLPFDQFMAISLYHPTGGYYVSPQTTLGKRGDFTTASEMSPLYAQCFAQFCRHVLTRHPGSAILELGAGSGRFAGHLLTSLDLLGDRTTPYYIYDISPTLRLKQQALLQTDYLAAHSRVRWLEALPTHFKGIILANEVLDALPVNCFRVQNGTIKERFVTLANDQLAWAIDEPTTPGLKEEGEQLRQDHDLPEGYESEINLQLPTFLKSLCDTLEEGVIVFADYGYGQREYYHPLRRHGTLTCFHQHTHHDNPLILPGQQDITAHVDFTRVIEHAATAGYQLAGFTTQAAFLLNCGLAALVTEQEKTLSHAEQFTLRQAVKQLTLPMEMGDRIKIMALQKHSTIPLMGFNAHDKRHEL